MGVISCEALAARIDEVLSKPESADLVICDLRFSLTDYEQGRQDFEHSHLLGARYVDLHRDLADHSGSQAGRHPLPSMRDFGAVVARLGITPDTQVVAYDAAGGAMAARLWWMLRAIGHHNVWVLDGGWPAWVEHGLPVTDEVPEVSLRVGDELTYRIADEWPGVVSARDVEAVLLEADPRARPMLIDARAPERFRGEVEPLDARAGHIPGAINLFNGLNLGPDGLHRTVDELREVYASLLDTNEVIMYCGSGVAACHNLLMLHLLGHDSGRLYAGSWSEWSADPTRPGAIGEGT